MDPLGHGSVNPLFEQLTPEQEEALRRQAIQSGMSPLDFLIPGGIGSVLGGALGYGAVRAGNALAGIPLGGILGGNLSRGQVMARGGAPGAAIGGLGMGIAGTDPGGGGSGPYRDSMRNMRDRMFTQNHLNQNTPPMRYPTNALLDF